MIRGILFTLLCLIFVAGCGQSGADPIDFEVALYFTAPGDDGWVGQAQAYHVKYSTNPIDAMNWNVATPVPDSLIKYPALGGMPDTVIFTIALEPSQGYYFAILACDDGLPGDGVPNCAQPSIPNKYVETPDRIPPAQITDAH
jgi:hypothetical protein